MFRYDVKINEAPKKAAQVKQKEIKKLTKSAKKSHKKLKKFEDKIRKQNKRGNQ